MENLQKKYGKWALIVGSTGGLGKSWAEECAKKGFNIIGCSNNLDDVKYVNKNIRRRFNVDTIEFEVDISQNSAAEIIIDQIKNLDVGMFIYNAAIEHVGYFIKVDKDYHNQQIIGNSTVPMQVSWYISRHMARKNKGVILLCSSMGAVVGCGNNAVYGAAKSFEMQLAKGLWYEMKKYGVTVAGITIGAIATPEFKRVQEQQRINFENENPGKKYKEAKAIEPSAAAEYVFKHLESGPQLYTSFGDRLSHKLLSILPSKFAVNMMGKVMDKNFSNGYDQLDDHFTEID